MHIDDEQRCETGDQEERLPPVTPSPRTATSLLRPDIHPVRFCSILVRDCGVDIVALLEAVARDRVGVLKHLPSVYQPDSLAIQVVLVLELRQGQNERKMERGGEGERERGREREREGKRERERDRERRKERGRERKREKKSEEKRGEGKERERREEKRSEEKGREGKGKRRKWGEPSAQEGQEARGHGCTEDCDERGRQQGVHVYMQFELMNSPGSLRRCLPRLCVVERLDLEQEAAALSPLGVRLSYSCVPPSLPSPESSTSYTSSTTATTATAATYRKVPHLSHHDERGPNDRERQFHWARLAGQRHS